MTDAQLAVPTLQIENRCYRSRDIKNRYNISDATLWRWRQAGKIPKPWIVNSQNIWGPEQVAEADHNVFGSPYPNTVPTHT